MKINKRIISVILIVMLVSICAITLCACGDETNTGNVAQHKKAIVICTALMSGGLYDTETGESIWDPLAEDTYYQQVLAGGDMAGFVVSLLTDGSTYDFLAKVLDYKNCPDNFVTAVSLDQDGNSLNPNIRPANTFNTVPQSSDGGYYYTSEYDGITLDKYGAYTGGSKVQYGALACYREQYYDLLERYGDKWDVTVFNYDWRIDNRKNSELLDQFIETNGWEQVVLTSHSMGGPVVAGYISRLYNQYIEETGNVNEAIKKVNEKILAYRAFSPATAGSVQAIYFLDNPLGAVYDTINGAVGGTLTDLVKDIDFLTEALADLAAPLAQNMTSIMQLLPFQQFMDSEYYNYANGESCVYVDGEPVRNLYEWYCSRTWAHKSSWVKETDANGNVLNRYDDLKYAMETLPEYWASFYLDLDGDGVKETYSPEIANTTYCLGVGYNTQKSVQITTVGTDDLEVNKVYYKIGDNNMGLVVTTDPSVAVTFDYSYDPSKQFYGEGDNTMPTHACIGGQDIDYTYSTTKSNTTQAIFCNINGENVRTNCPELVSRGCKVVLYDPADHGSVGGDWRILKYDFYDMFDDMVNERIKNGKYLAK